MTTTRHQQSPRDAARQAVWRLIREWQKQHPDLTATVKVFDAIKSLETLAQEVAP